MSHDQTSDSDPWLTLAEIGEELRVNPATVRLWITKGRLKASRAGERKWIVRRSDLDRMLADANLTPDDALDQLAAETPADGSVGAPRRKGPRRPAASGNSRNAAELLRLAVRSYEDAIEDSRYAPPSPGYIDRIRKIADACEHVAATMINAAENAGVRWTPQENFAKHLPYELQPGGNRPGPTELWDDFDATFDRLVITATAPDVIALAHGYRELADALNAVADELDQDEQWQAWERQAT